MHGDQFFNNAQKTPETFRLPKSGERDPYFCLTRSYYYRAEAEGRLKLKRLISPGCKRGITLVVSDDVRKMLASGACAPISTHNPPALPVEAVN